MESNFEALMKTTPRGDSLVKQLKIIFPSVSVGNMVNVTNSVCITTSATGAHTGGSVNQGVVAPNSHQNE